jgi:hypothetical protein
MASSPGVTTYGMSPAPSAANQGACANRMFFASRFRGGGRRGHAAQPDTRVHLTLTPPSRRGYCFVEYDTREDAERARLKTNGLRVFGKPLVCHFAEEKVLVKNV